MITLLTGIFAAVVVEGILLMRFDALLREIENRGEVQSRNDVAKKTREDENMYERLKTVESKLDNQEMKLDRVRIEVEESVSQVEKVEQAVESLTLVPTVPMVATEAGGRTGQYDE